MQTEMLIGSKFEKGTETEEQILNPKTGETILGLPEASQSQIEAAVAAAEKALVTWSRTTPAQRSGYLLKIADRIEAEAEAFSSLEALNCGKPINAVLNDEIPAIVDCYRFFAGAVRTLPGQIAGEYMPGHTSMVRRDPIGISSSSTPCAATIVAAPSGSYRTKRVENAPNDRPTSATTASRTPVGEIPCATRVATRRNAA